MKKVHITLLGKETLPAYYPIRMLQPDCVYIIGTDGNKTQANNLKNVIDSEHHECKICEASAYDIAQTQKVIEQIYDSLSDEDETTINITGGTKTMAIAAYNVGIAHQSDIVYTDSKNLIYVKNNQTTLLDCELTNELIFALQGQKLKSWIPLKERDEKAVEDSLAIQKFISTHHDVYQKLQGENMKQKKGAPILRNIPLENVRYQFDGKVLTVSKRGETILKIENERADSLLLAGRWWEVLVADALAKWSNGRYEIWQDVVFNPVKQTNSKYDKNEVDILVRIGTTLIFVECKSGFFDQNNIYKLDSVRSTYGSVKSKAILVSYYPFNFDLLEKASDKFVKIVYYNNKLNPGIKQFLSFFANKVDQMIHSNSLT